MSIYNIILYYGLITIDFVPRQNTNVCVIHLLSERLLKIKYKLMFFAIFVLNC